jgi:hypothetical protein
LEIQKLFSAEEGIDYPPSLEKKASARQATTRRSWDLSELSLR